MRNKIKEAGQTFVEYGVVIAVVACIAIAGLASAGSSINNKVTAMSGGSTEEPEPTSAYWGVSTDNVLTLSTKELTASEKSTDGGTFDLTSSDYVDGTWGKYARTMLSANIKDHMAPSDTSNWFAQMFSIVAINNIQNLDTSKDTNMGGMFGFCPALTSLDVSHFDTSNVTDMNCMFYGCESLTSLDVSSFNTSNVTDMSGMLWNCYSLTSLNVSSFDTSNVTNMNNMFLNCTSLTSLDVSHFNTSNVTDMSDMFAGCKSLTSLDVSHFDTSKVTNMCAMFQNCESLVSLDTSKFVIKAGTYTTNMYLNCPAHS